jgi:hypothetical protein
MRRLLVVCAFAGACGSDQGTSPPNLTFDFGPFQLDPSQEITDDCVQVTLNNDEPLDINQVEFTSGVGFHHSNWFWTKDYYVPGDDGTFSCKDRGYNEASAALAGGVLFAQSTQDTHEIQTFPEGVVVRIPPHAKIVAGIHLLNASDNPLTVPLELELTAIPATDVTIELAGVSFEDHALGLPAMASSSFSQDCDLSDAYMRETGHLPDFNIYYALGHYHSLGTGLTLEAVRADGTSTVVYTTQGRIGDALGGKIDPPFAMAGYTRLRYTCDFYNPRTDVVAWGVGDQEMCVYLAFTDAPINLGGGQPFDVAPGDPTIVDGVSTYSYPCQVLSTPLNGTN